MNKPQLIIIIALLPVLVSMLCSCSDRARQSELQKYSELYVHYCRSGQFDSLAVDAGRVFAACSRQGTRAWTAG